MSFLSRLTHGAKLASAPLLLAGLAACATPFNADVSRFQLQLPAPTGQSFAVVAEDPTLANSLEFATYAERIAAEMQQLGYARAPSADSATLLVRFDYGVDGGRERVQSYPATGFGPWGGWGGWGGYGRFGRWGRGFYPGFYGGGWGGWGGFGGGWGSDVRSYTIYTSGIDVKIDRVADGQRLFEGKAQAVSTSNRLQYLVPNLVEAMFTDFPGNSGETLRISIAPEDQPVQRSNR